MLEEDDVVDSERLLVKPRSQVSETQVSRPSRERERIKALLKKELESEDIRYLIARADAIYEFT